MRAADSYTMSVVHPPKAPTSVVCLLATYLVVMPQNNLLAQNVASSVTDSSTPIMMYFLVIMVLLLAALVVLFFLFGRYRDTKLKADQLLQMNQQLVERNQALNKTLNGLEKSHEENTRKLKVLAHDLRNPIAAMISLADMLFSDGKYSPEEQEILEMFKVTGMKSMKMVSDILQTKAKSGIEIEEVELSELLNYCISLMQFTAGEKRVQIVFKGKPIHIQGDREKLWRVFNNLIANAIKFSEEGNVIEVKLTKNNDHALISVKDEGVGIPVELKDTIFDAFTTSKRPGSLGEHASGLGLSICKQIVEAHEGNIWFVSEPKKGTTFHVKLPMYL